MSRQNWSTISPAVSSDQRVQSSHHVPALRCAVARHASAGPAAASSSWARNHAFGFGGLTMPAMWPPLLSTNRTGPLTRDVVLYADSHGTMWSLIALTT